MTKLSYPFSEDAVRALAAGDVVSVNGRVWTGRDRLHKHFADGGAIPVDMRDGALYHCGPVVVPAPPAHPGAAPWRVAAGGPTTSMRENPYEAAFMEKTGVRLVIGKGGMDATVLDACKRLGAVYLQAVGGAAAVTARAVKSVENVYFLDDFGAAEACWELEMDDFQCVVAMDSHGTSLFDSVQRESLSKFNQLIS
jgi:fumarate hydratase class I